VADSKEIKILKRQVELAEEALDLERSIFAKEQEQPSRGEALIRGIRQGVTFGFGDELEAGFRGAKSFVTTPGDLSTRSEAAGLTADASFKNSAARRSASRREFPGTSITAEMLGGGALGAGTFTALNNSLKGLSLIPRVLGIGAGEGALFGAGTAQPGERLEGAALGGGLGLVATPLAAGIGTSIAGALRPIARRLGDKLFGTNRDRAVREIRAALQADDITPDEANILLNKFGKGATLADLGDTLARQGRAATSELGPAASQTKRFLDERQIAGQTQLRQVARRATGEDNFDKGIIEIINNAESSAAPIYKEVFSEVLDVTQRILGFLDRPAIQSAKKKAATLLRNEGFSDDIINDVTDVRYMDAIKRALDDQIGVARRSGNNNQARVLTQLKNDFVAEIDNQVPRYAEARAVFAGEQSIKEASEFGRVALQGNKRTSDIVEQINGMGDSELQAARAGFLDWLTDELSRQSTKRNTIFNKFEDVPKFRQTIEALFPSKQAVDDFINRAAALSQFGRTRNIVTGGSPTARIQADRAALSPGLLGTLLDASVSPGGTLAKAVSSIRGNTKLSADVLNEMQRILFNPDFKPSQLKRDIIPGLFDIPKSPPVVTAGTFGGLVGSQQEGIFNNLRAVGLIQ